jgi:hypothetical protein
MRPLQEDDDLFTISDFMEDVNEFMITPDDGMGFWATETEREYGWDAQINVYGLKIGKVKPPEWATHVAWFNK